MLTIPFAIAKGRLFVALTPIHLHKGSPTLLARRIEAQPLTTKTIAIRRANITLGQVSKFTR